MHMWALLFDWKREGAGDAERHMKQGARRPANSAKSLKSLKSKHERGGPARCPPLWSLCALETAWLLRDRSPSRVPTRQDSQVSLRAASP